MKARDRQYIGILATENDTEKDPVFINGPQMIQYQVKSLTLPEQDITSATGYMSSFDSDTDIYDDQYAESEDRINAFRDAVEEKVFIYTYIITDEGKGKLQNFKASLVPRPSGFSEEDHFYPLPVFGKKTDETEDWEYRHNFRLFRNCKSLEEFKKLILEKKSVGATYGYDPDAFTPSFVIWYEDNKFYAIGHVTSNYEASTGGIIVECDNLVSFEIKEYLNKVVYQESVNPTVMFIADSVYELIEGKIIELDQSVDGVRTTTKDDLKTDENKEYVQNSISEEKSSVRQVDETPKVDEKTDESIIQMMDYHSIKSGLYYDIKDFVNFHTSIKSGNLVILSGLSGTGKSRIVDMYANAIGIKTTEIDNRLLFIPVRPSWNDDSDLLGYVDLVHMVYRPADSGFVDFLVKAQRDENKNNIYLVCFDEMNLARVEHYFSQFLSLLERPVQQRNLQLYDEQYSGKLYNSKDYPSSITIGENVKFIGTVNVDESTYHFSDKVLDRANVIELNVLNFSADWENDAKKYSKTISTPIWNMEDYKKICKAPKIIPRVHELLWDMHNVLHTASSKFGVGPRVVKSIDLYLANIPEEFYDKLSIADGIDLQVAQRIMTKVRGSENELGEVIDGSSDNSFEAVLNKYSDLSLFTKCRELLRQKQRELKAYGYCI